MKFALLTLAALGLLGAAVTARAEGEGNGDPFPFRAPGTVVMHPSALADTGSAAYPDVSGRPGQVLAAPGTSQGTLPPNGSEGAVQTAASLPRGSFDGTAPVMQARSADRYIAAAAARRLATHQPARTGHG